MKTLVFDAGPIITLSLNGLLWILPELKQKFNGRFLMPNAVKEELITRPLATKKYKLEAFQVMQLINNGTLEVIQEIETRKTTDKLLQLMNSIYFARGHSIKIVHDGEIDAISLVLLYQAKGLIVDERNTRYLIETPQKLKKRLEHKLHTNVTVDKSKLSEIRQLTKHIPTVRSAELVTVAFELGVFAPYLTTTIPKQKKQLLEGLLWACKLKGCAMQKEEIMAIVREYSR